ncbi:Phage portal protein [Candidatus Phycorickettsia trachydisci]|uniref:Phage portal protein n=1 Tax=Candidatus Phycorickettsia trachydisci TaxID=2115978 RepID=A0A2P1P852_9RICK|nr:phage portal protein [Candidatus Phycorickettsia trachydisci]AVP87441.1 Phage portal protein [Candidatus Phycorickettsia trachydisci]
MLQYIQKFFHSKKSTTNYLENFYFSDPYEPKAGIESYRNNVIVNRCVNVIAQSAGHVPWVVMQKTSSGFEKVTFHHLARLLKKPNPMKAGAEFFAEIIANKLLFGNSYILAISNNNKPVELHSLNPQAVQVICEKGSIVGYKYITNNNTKYYPVDSVNKHSQVLHIKNYHPTDPIYGLSCLDPASKLIDLHNKSTEWNHTLLKNGARPSGALVVNNGGYLSEDQFERLRSELNDKYYGSNNAGKPMLLEGGLDWKEMSISPKDMDFIESRNSAAREIALAFGVPPQLLGINGDNTYSNMQEARLALWEETLIPLLDKIADGLTNWLSFWFQDEFIVDFDRDSISVLTEKRQKLWSNLNNINFMSANEKRAMANLPRIQNGDKVAEEA